MCTCEVYGARVGDGALVQQQRDQPPLARQLHQPRVAHLQGRQKAYWRQERLNVSVTGDVRWSKGIASRLGSCTTL